MPHQMVLKIFLISTTLMIFVTAGEGGTSHKKIVIHVPYKIHHVHHTHTVYKHVGGHSAPHSIPHSAPHSHAADDHEYFKVIGFSGGIDNGITIPHGSEGHGTEAISNIVPHPPKKSSHTHKYKKQPKYDFSKNVGSSSEEASYEEGASNYGFTPTFGDFESQEHLSSFKHTPDSHFSSPSKFGAKHKNKGHSTSHIMIKHGKHSTSYGTHGKFHKHGSDH